MSLTNYPAIYVGFAEKGIPESEIEPRVNVLTFHAWRALGRHVRRGEHGVRVLTWIVCPDKVDGATGELKHKGGRRPKAAVVFHVSQTDVDSADDGARRRLARAHPGRTATWTQEEIDAEALRARVTYINDHPSREEIEAAI
jgi:antirestriction protein ArdC